MTEATIRPKDKHTSFYITCEGRGVHLGYLWFGDNSDETGGKYLGTVEGVDIYRLRKMLAAHFPYPKKRIRAAKSRKGTR